MVEQRLEQEYKSTETVQYIENGRMKTEMGVWKQEQSARRLKQNNEDRNMVRDLRSHSGVLESDDIASEVLGVGWSSGGVVV